MAKKTAAKRATSSASRPKTAKKKGKSQASIQAELKRIDKELVKLLNRRAASTVEFLQAADDPQKESFKPSADEELYASLRDQNKGPLTERALRGVFREIVSDARQQVKVQRVAYLGPALSLTHLAAIERFSDLADLIPVSNIATVFESVNRGQADFGLVPIENTTEGRIVDTLDMFTRLPLRICGEVQLRVHHNMLANCPRSEVTEIYAKPQSFSQCREWLTKNMPQAKQIDVTSTSTAAQLAKTKHGVAAIASTQAAVEFGLQIIAADIQDVVESVTRFAVIGDSETKSTGSDRTAILLQISHKPGALADTLAIFKQNKINLTWIESFPLQGAEDDYLFFMDFEGHATDAKVKKTLTALEKLAVRIEVLGSYPRSEPID